MPAARLRYIAYGDTPVSCIYELQFSVIEVAVVAEHTVTFINHFLTVLDIPQARRCGAYHVELLGNIRLFTAGEFDCHICQVQCCPVFSVRSAVFNRETPIMVEVVTVGISTFFHRVFHSGFHGLVAFTFIYRLGQIELGFPPVRRISDELQLIAFTCRHRAFPHENIGCSFLRIDVASRIWES